MALYNHLQGHKEVDIDLANPMYATTPISLSPMSDLKAFVLSYSSESCPWPGCSQPTVGEQVALDHLAQQSVHVLDHNAPLMTRRCDTAF